MKFEEIPYAASFRVGVFLLHLFLVPIVLLIICSSFGESWVADFIAQSFGFALGFCVASLIPRCAREGRWVFAAALAVFAWGFLYELSQFPLRKVMRDFFLDEDMLVLFTLPAWGCCCYSAGIALVLRLARKTTDAWGER